MRIILKYFLSACIVLILLSFDKYEIPPVSDNSNNPEIHKTKLFGNKRNTDGPYIFYENDNTIIKWIRKDQLKEKLIYGNNFKLLKRKFGLDLKEEWLNKQFTVNYNQVYDGVDSLIAISDIHGQFDVFAKLLKIHNVVDHEFNWNFGTGHLVILGDVFDRGPNVTESLWLIYKLEQQAEEKGGKVHLLLGNHELMIFKNDLRYIHEKYVRTAHLMETTYSEAFSEQSLLGKWLRTKPVMVSINDFLFVHAGISPDFISKGITIEQSNKIFSDMINGKNWENVLSDSTLSFMMGNKGPIWYRGYFNLPVLEEQQIDLMLTHFKLKRIVVGHTSFPNITSLFNGKIIGIDSSIKLGDYGEVFIYKQNKIFRGSIHGNIIPL